MSASPNITTVFWDIGGVLLHNGWDRAKRHRAADLFGLDFQEMDERHHLTFDTYESGKITLDEYLDRLVFYEERPFSRDEFKAFMIKTEYYPAMISLARRIKTKYGLRMAALSNEGRELTTHRIREHRLSEFIDFFMISSFVHIRKPDEDIYRMALDVAQVLPRNVVYIDDRSLFVEVAQKIGLLGIHHMSHESTVNALEAIGFRTDV
jgi:putative hydrolase of the HAD superfamily